MGSRVVRIVKGSIDRLRLREFDTLAPEARSRERYKRVGLSAVASVGARGIGVATALMAA